MSCQSPYEALPEGESIVQVGKSYAARAARATNKKEAEALAEEGLERVAATYQKGATAVEGLKDMAKQLRRLPVVDLSLPTVSIYGPFLVMLLYSSCLEGDNNSTCGLKAHYP
jgi:hypothetical protein